MAALLEITRQDWQPIRNQAENKWSGLDEAIFIEIILLILPSQALRCHILQDYLRHYEARVRQTMGAQVIIIITQDSRAPYLRPDLC